MAMLNNLMVFLFDTIEVLQGIPSGKRCKKTLENLNHS